MKVALFGVVLLGLTGLVTVALIRERTAPGRTATAGPTLAPPRAALTPAEELYARALWSIHNEVKDGAFRMTLAGLGYKTGSIDPAEFKTRMRAVADIYQRADTRIQVLAPPASLQPVHAKYLEAVRLFERSAAEMAKASEAGRDEHLAAAFPLSREASRQLLEVGKDIWPGEYVPN
jgi:hypothetical protein